MSFNPAIRFQVLVTLSRIFPGVAAAFIGGLSPEALEDASAVAVRREELRLGGLGLEPAVPVVRGQASNLVAGHHRPRRHNDGCPLESF